jgi:hypothetical protein
MRGILTACVVLQVLAPLPISAIEGKVFIELNTVGRALKIIAE